MGELEMERLIDMLYKCRCYRLAYWLADRYMPPIHPMNFNDEEGA
jgi:hypothetical protein